MTATVVAHDVAGRTRFTTLRSSPPISLRATAEGLFLVASGAGPVGGDSLRLDVEVNVGADVIVRSAAAALVLPGPTGAPSSMAIDARVAGALRWQPEPTILVHGCDHTASTRISLTPEATLVWQEDVVLGRHGEPSGSMLQRLWVDIDGRPLVRSEVPFGPRWRGAAGPAGTDGATRVRSTLLVNAGRPPTPGGLSSVVELREGAWMVVSLRAPEPRSQRNAPMRRAARDSPAQTASCRRLLEM